MRLITTLRRTNNLLILSAVASICVALVGPAEARTHGFERQAVDASARADGATPAGQHQYPPEELELLRSQLLDLTDAVKEFSDTLMPNDTVAAEKLAAARERFASLSWKELNVLRNSLDPSKLNVGLPDARARLAQFKTSIEVSALTRSKGKIRSASGTLPVRSDPNAACQAVIGSGRPGADVIRAADEIYFIAEGVAEAADDACNQIAVLVIAGEGGGANTSLACVATDVVYFVAVGVRTTLTTCDMDFTARTVDANFSRLDFIHSGISDSVTNDNTNTTTILSDLTAAETAITTTDTTNKNIILAAIGANTTTVTTALNSSSTAIINNDNSNEMTIVNAIGTSTTTVNNLATTNTTNILSDLATSTTTIITDVNARAKSERAILLEGILTAEPNLHSTSQNQILAILYLPASEGGLLEEIRDLVTARLSSQSKLGIGSALGAAQAALTQGNALLAQNQFVAAFLAYRLAFNNLTTMAH